MRERHDPRRQSQSRSSGKERDSETGLDYFGARYYGSTMGRWLSPDWSEAPEPVPYADFFDPQTLNLYGYVRNNPILHADTDGHCWPLSQCADKIQATMSAISAKATDLSIRTGLAKVAKVTTFVVGTTTDTVTAVTGSILRTGEASGAAMDSGNFMQKVDAVSGDVMTGAGTALLLVGPAVSAGVGQTRGNAGAGTKPAVPEPESVPATGPKVTPAQRAAVNEIGNRTGCHTCGATSPGTKSGSWVPDHQPPTALNPAGGQQVLKPQCLQCSRVQGGQVAAAVRKAKVEELK